MEKIAVILPALLPVPSVLGGAVESIINNMIDENERTPIFSFRFIRNGTKRQKRKANNTGIRSFSFLKPIRIWRGSRIIGTDF